MKGSDQSLSGQTAKSLKKDRQINNEQKCNPASGNEHVSVNESLLYMCMCRFRALGVVCFILLSPQWDKKLTNLQTRILHYYHY